MVEDAGEHMIKIVDDLLDTLTDGEHSKTISALEKKEQMKVNFHIFMTKFSSDFHLKH